MIRQRVIKAPPRTEGLRGWIPSQHLFPLMLLAALCFSSILVLLLVMTGAHLLMLAIVRYALPTFLVLLLLAAVAVDRLLGRSRIGNAA